jgi:hypothetical protein
MNAMEECRKQERVAEQFNLKQYNWALRYARLISVFGFLK